MGDSARTIENLLYTYAERIDAGDLEGVADLFVHGRIKAAPDAPSEAIFEGRERVLTPGTSPRIPSSKSTKKPR